VLEGRPGIARVRCGDGTKVPFPSVPLSSRLGTLCQNTARGRDRTRRARPRRIGRLSGSASHQPASIAVRRRRGPGLGGGMQPFLHRRARFLSGGGFVSSEVDDVVLNTKWSRLRNDEPMETDRSGEQANQAHPSRTLRNTAGAAAHTERAVGSTMVRRQTLSAIAMSAAESRGGVRHCKTARVASG